MSSEIQIIAIITPKPGKANRVIELLQEVSEYIKTNEPTTARYEITKSFNKETNTEEIIMIESYKDKAAIALHGDSEAFKSMQRKVRDEGLTTRPMQLKIGSLVGGFASRL